MKVREIHWITTTLLNTMGSTWQESSANFNGFINDLHYVKVWVGLILRPMDVRDQSRNKPVSLLGVVDFKLKCAEFFTMVDFIVYKVDGSDHFLKNRLPRKDQPEVPTLEEILGE